MREAPSRTLIEGAVGRGARDARTIRWRWTRRRRYGDRRDDLTLRGARLRRAATVPTRWSIVTEWQEFRSPDFDAIKARARAAGDLRRPQPPATSSASSWSWVTKTLVTCSSSCSRRSQRRSSLRTCASSAPNGSSSSSTRGSTASARASATRWRWPPGELRGIACGQPVELHELEQLAHAASDLGFAGRARAAARAGRRRRSRTPSCGGTARSAGTRSRLRVRAARRSVASSPSKRTCPRRALEARR